MFSQSSAPARTFRFLAISGSLRAASSNTAALAALRATAPKGVAIALFDGLDGLPYFNPDLDGEAAGPPPAVAAFRGEVGRSDAVLISSPEYAHGMPGALKNALDWLVGSTEFPGKPTAVINIAPRSAFVHAALRETLVTMSAVWIDDPALTVPLPRRSMSVAEIAADQGITNSLRAATDAVIRACLAPGSEC